MNLRRFPRLAALALLTAAPALVSCSSDEASDDGGSSGSGGTGPTGGTAGSASGSAGASTGGSGGSSTGGSAGTTTGGTAGTATGGSAGSASGAGGAAGTDGGGGPGGAGAATGGSSGGGGVGGGAIGGAGSGGAGPGGSGGKGGASGAGGKGGASGAGGKGGSGGAGSFTVTSTAFANMPGCGPGNMASSCATFPINNTSFGTNVSPPMTWTGAPAGTQSFVVLMQDLTNGMAHWVLWNIPASVTSLPENISKTSAMPPVPAGSQQCSIGQGDGYFGSGRCGNVYEFVIYALGIPTFSPTMATDQTAVRTQLQALGAQILGTASMRARSFEPEC